LAKFDRFKTIAVALSRPHALQGRDGMLCPGHPFCSFASRSAHSWSNSCFRQVDDQTPQKPSQIRHDTRCYHKLSWILNPAMWQKKTHRQRLNIRVSSWKMNQKLKA